MVPFVILNGFDRSGTSAISRLISSHPDVELLMQPFNSGFIRKSMNLQFEHSSFVKEGVQFFDNFLSNKIDNSLIESYWYYNHSTTNEYVKGKLHLTKTTINHMAQKWMKENYPEIPVWGVWRSPLDIIRSIFKNNFQNEWYKGALSEIEPTIKEVNFLQSGYESFLTKVDSPVKSCGLLIAVRTHYFLYYLDSDKLLDYNLFKKDPNYLNIFLNYYGLSDYNFNSKAEQDLNLIGIPYKSREEVSFTQDDMSFLNEAFAVLENFKNKKFSK